ncbi:F-box protein [Aspergillus lucknowensis]|uniref:F-box domain-containing protein n=1 Tax=Aspergillus lucknowensis TaxID=176173 RepID=A0ABR4LLK6_9EURO
MAFDCYCAICGVGFSGMRVGSPSDATPDRRRRCVERIARSLEGTTTVDADEDEPIYTYDPRLVDSDNVAWTSQLHCLGMHDDATGKSRAFISGPGYYADAGELAVKIGQPSKRTYFNCYGFGTDEVPGPVMPFHWCCFEILLRTLTGTTEPRNVNLEALYDAMSSLCNWSGSALRLPYGEDVLRAQGKYWQCLPGAEYSVSHPGTSIKDAIQTHIQTNQNLRIPPVDIDITIGNRHPTNPFGTLPTELIHHICSLLPGDSLKSLIQASLFIHLVTRDNAFWKRFIESDIPWLDEADTHALRTSSSSPPTDLNYQLVHQWLDAATTPTYGMADPVFMGAANRRRIWGVCEELSRSYRALCK